MAPKCGGVKLGPPLHMQMDTSLTGCGWHCMPTSANGINLNSLRQRSNLFDAANEPQAGCHTPTPLLPVIARASTLALTTSVIK